VIDRDEDGRPTEAFYTEAQPCESCGEPTYRGRVWNPRFELWIATDCTCNLPEQPVCPLLRPVIESAQTVGQLVDRTHEHRLTCPLCGPRQIERKAQPAQEAEGESEAA
jgi:predicted RNA-binding Zn-ribbon protein involved in translation (DUF1610 family)